MLIISSLIFNVISYKKNLNNIYIASHLHVKKDSWIFFKPSFFINTKLKKYENLNAFQMCLIVPYYNTKRGWNKFYFEN
jgi:hypothetical protein